MVKLLQNPIVFRMLFGAFVCIAAFLVATVVIRAMRKSMVYKPEPERVATENNPLFSLAAYNGVIQQLREQEKELKKLREQERDRAAATENISEAVLSNLTSGVVFFDRMGIVRQVNGAAKSLLGYASPFGFHIRDLFCGIREVRWPAGDTSSSAAPFVAEMERTIRDATPFQRVEADYVTPTGEKRVLGIGASAVRGKKGEILGVSCLVADLTHISELSRQVQLKENLASLGEMSAGIAHEFKNSLATISGYAQMLVQEAASETARGFAGKIASETESLSRIVTEFL
ncbi:MAG TPA: histidine kinase dimerization/phospho-acceptor domain-containing protein, partial [Candidatus Angelobacter sp.]|nr:histidine kinase dimerization/phospho-acceptor domain-containing protein [Candidatus Angelobacter sp.]